jgi:hypothetical protein
LGEKSKVKITTDHNKLVCAEANHTAIANRDACGAWEQFHTHIAKNGKVAFRSHHGKVFVIVAE